MIFDLRTISLELSKLCETHLANCVIVKYCCDLGKLLLNCLLRANILKNRNAAPEFVSEEVKAIGGGETHVGQVIDRLHTIS